MRTEHGGLNYEHVGGQDLLAVAPVPEPFWAEITKAYWDGEQERWTYAWEVVRLTENSEGAIFFADDAWLRSGSEYPVYGTDPVEYAVLRPAIEATHCIEGAEQAAVGTGVVVRMHHGPLVTVQDENGDDVLTETFLFASPSEQFADFELKYDLTPGGNTTAHLRINGETDTDTEIEVYDSQGCFRGRGKDVYAEPHNEGSIGRARFNSESGHWEITVLTPHALMIRGLTSAAVVGESTFTLAATVSVYQPTGGIIVTQDPATAVTIQNTDMVWTIDSGAPVIAVWNEAGANWQAIQAKCPE